MHFVQFVTDQLRSETHAYFLAPSVDTAHVQKLLVHVCNVVAHIGVYGKLNSGVLSV